MLNTNKAGRELLDVWFQMNLAFNKHFNANSVINIQPYVRVRASDFNSVLIDTEIMWSNGHGAGADSKTSLEILNSIFYGTFYGLRLMLYIIYCSHWVCIAFRKFKFEDHRPRGGIVVNYSSKPLFMLHDCTVHIESLAHPSDVTFSTGCAAPPRQTDIVLQSIVPAAILKNTAEIPTITGPATTKTA